MESRNHFMKFTIYWIFVFYALAFLQFSLVSGWKMGEGGQMHYRSDIYSIGCQEGTEEAFSSMNFNHFQMGNNIQTRAHLRYYQLSTFRHCVTQPSLTVVQERLVVGVTLISSCLQPDISPFIYYKGQIQEDHFMKKEDSVLLWWILVGMEGFSRWQTKRESQRDFCQIHVRSIRLTIGFLSLPTNGFLF